MNRLFRLLFALGVCTALLAGCLLPAGRGAGNGQTTTEPSGPETAENDAYDYFSPPDGYGDITKISVGMTYQEVIEVMPQNCIANGLGAGLYINDRETNHVFHVALDFKWPMTVVSVTDTGIDVDYIAPLSALDRLEKGMTFDEVVQILGRPLYNPLSGMVAMLWRAGDRDNKVLLYFADGEHMIFQGF